MLEKIRTFAVAHVNVAAALVGLAGALVFDGAVEGLFIFAGGGVAIAASVVPSVWKFLTEKLDDPD